MNFMRFKEFITFLGTKDLDKISHFYQHILGMTIYKHQDVCLIFNIINQNKISFCEHLAVVHEDKSLILTFVTEKVDEPDNKLIKFRIDYVEQPKINEKFNNNHFFFKDPNGYTIEIQQFLDKKKEIKN